MNVEIAEATFLEENDVVAVPRECEGRAEAGDPGPYNGDAHVTPRVAAPGPRPSARE